MDKSCLSKKFETLKENVGIVISPNGFFSTSRSIHVALSFIADRHESPEKMIVLFEIIADPRIESVIFSDIETQSRMRGEQEIY